MQYTNSLRKSLGVTTGTEVSINTQFPPDVTTRLEAKRVALALGSAGSAPISTLFPNVDEQGVR